MVHFKPQRATCLPRPMQAVNTNVLAVAMPQEINQVRDLDNSQKGKFDE